MCGIAGIFSYASASPIDEGELTRIRDAMQNRGPDGIGMWIADDRRIGLAHRRLAIIDLAPSGAQPMASANGSLRITFNGEIYNYKALRRELEAKGHAFQSNSDTEVLLHLYADRGAEMVHGLRGMYALAIWDEARRGLLLARDPFGIKPLYYSNHGSSFRFASQVKALVAGGGVPLAEAPAGHVGFFIFGSVPEPYTTYRAIRALPAGSTMWIDGSGARAPHCFFDIPSEISAARERVRSERVSASRDLLREVLSQSLDRHLVADVPVGIFLSSGLDSTTIAALASQRSKESLKSITLAFEEYKGTPDDESPLAETIASLYGTNHETRWITKEDFDAERERILKAMDQPSIDGINTYFVSKVAAEAGMKVALSGLGGDEFFRGYPSFTQVPHLVRTLRWGKGVPKLGRFLRRLSAPLIGRLTSPKYAGLLEYGGSHAGAYLLRRALYMPWELEQVLDPTVLTEGLAELEALPRISASHRDLEGSQAIVSALESSWYMKNQLLRDADWAGMAHSLEIRVPFVDVDVFRAAAGFFDSGHAFSKHDVAEATQVALPAEVRIRRKTGFTVPVERWTRSRTSVPGHRGLRQWAQKVDPSPIHKSRVIVLVSDAFGGIGGIAKFNRDLVGALAAMPECEAILVLPRLVSGPLEPIPAKVDFQMRSAGGKIIYMAAALRSALRFGPADLVVCGHINLLPAAAMVGFLRQAPTLLILHGIDAWNPTRSALCNRLARRADAVAAVSRTTLDRFQAWTGFPAEASYILPNCVDLIRYGPGPRARDLVERYDLSGKTTLLTVGRLSEFERYKGFDEVIEALGQLRAGQPDLVYLIAGDGPDRARLEGKVRSLGLESRVKFLGFIPEARKADYYRLADAYVMPSRGEGFGIVYLEALACGVPVLGSTLDGSRDALLEGALGILVDPSSPDDVQRGILSVLKKPRGIPAKLSYYSAEMFARRVHSLMRDLTPRT